MGLKAKSGFYKVKNQHKLILPLNDSILKNRIITDDDGDVNFEYRSSWEYYYMKELDFSEDVMMWGYECDTIKYLDPTSNFKERNYFIDFIVYWKTGVVEYIEVKPFYQTVKPEEPKSKQRNGKNTKKYDKYLGDCVTYEKNMAKWNACKIKCDNLSASFNVDYKFSIATEQDRLSHLPIKK